MIRVLVADDESTYREHLARILRDEGFEVCVAGTAEEVLSRGKQCAPALAVIDYMLEAGTTGIELADQLQEWLPDLIVLMITGYPAYQIQGEVPERLPVTFLQKPFDTAGFRSAVRETLAAHGISAPGGRGSSSGGTSL
jgi:DNA-binding NtrC family response regulator